MRREAETHAEEDRKRRDLIEARNQADTSLYAAEKALLDFGSKVPAAVRDEIQVCVDELRRAKDGEDADSIRKAVAILDQAIQRVGVSVYQGPEVEAGRGESEPSDGVVDGEVREG
jgi:molecular chaperone DnaK